MDVKQVEDKNNLQVIERIDKKLRTYNMPDIDMLKSNVLEHLVKIEKSIIDIENDKKDYITKYKSAKINIKSIGERTGMSRTTIYKYRGILEPYINNSQIELDEIDVIKRLEEKIELVNELIELNENLQRKKLNEMIQLDKVEYLENELKSAIRQIKNLQIENSKLNDLLAKKNNVRHLF